MQKYCIKNRLCYNVYIMLVHLKFNNSFVFLKEQEFSLKADMRFKKLSSNVVENNEILKSVCIYGPNNSGKTCIIRILTALKNIISNKPFNLSQNLFSENPHINLSARFIEDGSLWEYAISYDNLNKEFLYERFEKIFIDQYKNEKTDVYFERNLKKNLLKCKDVSLIVDVVKTVIGKTNTFLNLIDVSYFELLKYSKKILTDFANSLIILDMNNIPLDQTISILKNHTELQEDVVSFIKNADIDLDDYKYLGAEQLKISADFLQNGIRPNEDVINQRIQQSIEDSLRLTSVYKGKEVPSLLFDSTGTKKIAALASYVINALKNGQTLIIDELDSSIHFKLTRSIVSMFNNELNNNAQLIFTAHDVSLMDCKKLFRKEQIWFVHKDRNEGAYLYSLADFRAEDGIRDTTDLFEKYKKGVLGAIPEPDMLKTLLQVKNE